MIIMSSYTIPIIIALIVCDIAVLILSKPYWFKKTLLIKIAGTVVSVADLAIVILYGLSPDNISWVATTLFAISSILRLTNLYMPQIAIWAAAFACTIFSILLFVVAVVTQKTR